MAPYEPQHGRGPERGPREAGPAARSGGTRGVPDGLLVGTLAFLLGLTALTWTAAGLSGLLAHGSWPEGVRFTRTPLAMRALATEPHDMAAAWPGTPAEVLSGSGLFWGIFISQLMILVVLTVFVLGTLTRWRAVRAARRMAAQAAPDQARKEADGGAGAPGDAQGAAGTAGAVPQGQASAPAPGVEAAPANDPAATSARPPAAPSPDGEAPAEARGVEAQDGRPTAVPAPRNPGPPVETAADTGPQAPGAALTPRLRYAHGAEDGGAAEAVQDAEGAAIVVTGDLGLYSGTVGARAKLGPVHVYDPGQLTDAPSRLRWDPHHGCADMSTARARAAALLAPVRSPARSDSAVHDAAETLLRCWLHAAAVAGEQFRQVHRWAQSGSSKDAVRILRTDTTAAPGSAGELEATLTAHPERREAATVLVRRALACVAQLHIRNACTASRADRIASESFIAEGGTLYIVGDLIEDPHRGDPGAMPLVTALTSAVVEHGRRMAARSSAGRLDPPLTVVLDRPATVAPLPELPALLADGEAVGLVTDVVLRSEEQARRWWPTLAHRTGTSPQRP